MPQMSLLRARSDTDGTCSEQQPSHGENDRPDPALRHLQ